MGHLDEAAVRIPIQLLQHRQVDRLDAIDQEPDAGPLHIPVLPAPCMACRDTDEWTSQTLRLFRHRVHVVDEQHLLKIQVRHLLNHLAQAGAKLVGTDIAGKIGPTPGIIGMDLLLRQTAIADHRDR